MRKLLYSGAFILLCTFGSAGGAFALEASAASPSASVPAGIRALLGPSDTLLAYKLVDSLGSGEAGAVIVVRHALTDDRSHNPCDLTVLRKEGDAFAGAGSSNRAVECIYNEITRRVGELALGDQLNVKPQEITWSNELTKGHSAYTFVYASEKSSWYLQRAEVTFVENAESGDDVNVYREVVNYPGDIARISMSEFNPGAIRKALARHRESIK